jgi:hypothetical protein
VRQRPRFKSRRGEFDRSTNPFPFAWAAIVAVIVFAQWAAVGGDVRGAAVVAVVAVAGMGGLYFWRTRR